MKWQYKKSFLIIGMLIILSLFASPALAVTETRYHRSDTHTVNGLNAYKLGTSNSASSSYFEGSFATLGCVGVYWRSDVYIRHSDGSETKIGSDVAEVSRGGSEGTEQGYQSATWSCPETNLATTDAIKVVEKIVGSEVLNTRTFVSEQLGATKLNSATWTFTRYTYYGCSCGGQCNIAGRLYHGDSSHATRIEGFSYTTTVSPTVTTQSADNITYTSATLHGTINDTGGENADQRGFDWGLTTSYGNSWTESGNFGTGAFSHTISGLEPGTTYHFRAKAHNSAGWGYGSDMTFTTTAYVDCGLRAYNGTAIITIACEPAGTLTSPLRIRKGSTTYGIVLVDPSDSHVSNIRIKTSSGIKALREL